MNSHSVSLLKSRPKLHSTVGRGHWLDALPSRGCRMGSRAAQGLWPGFLVRWGRRLCSAAGGSLSGWNCRLGPVAGTAHWLGVQSRQNCQHSSPARCGHRLGSANGQSHRLGPVLAASSAGTGSTGTPAPAAASPAPPHLPAVPVLPFPPVVPRS